MPMDESDLAWGLGLLAVTAAGVLIVLILVVGIVLLFRRFFWRQERIATESDISALAVLARNSRVPASSHSRTRRIAFLGSLLAFLLLAIVHAWGITQP
jgi:hypothetical protein